MAKTEAIKFTSFIRNEWKQESKKEKLVKVLFAGNGALLILLPKTALAATANGTFGNVHEAIMNFFDAGVVLVLIFAGAAWALGHRPKAIEIIIGTCIGYTIARHSVDIRDFLKTI